MSSSCLLALQTGFKIMPFLPTVLPCFISGHSIAPNLFRRIKNVVKVVNASTHVSPSPSALSKRGGPEKTLHCSKTYAAGDDYQDFIKTEWEYVELPFVRERKSQ